MGPDTSRVYRDDGAEHTLEDVSLESILQVAELKIESHVSEDRRDEVFQKVMQGMPGRRETPRWVKPPPDNPRERPQYVFSTPKSVSYSSPCALIHF